MKGRMLTTRPSPKSKIVLRYLLQLKCSIVEEKQSRHNQEFKTFEGLGHGYRHLREIVCLLTKVGGPATVYSHGTESGDKSIHWPRIEHQSMFNGGQQHNYYCQQRQAAWANEQSISLDVCGQGQGLWLSSSERSLATSEVRGSNPIIGTFFTVNSIEKTKINKNTRRTNCSERTNRIDAKKLTHAEFKT